MDNAQIQIYLLNLYLITAEKSKNQSFFKPTNRDKLVMISIDYTVTGYDELKWRRKRSTAYSINAIILFMPYECEILSFLYSLIYVEQTQRILAVRIFFGQIMNFL
jgi:hypothetical protein